MARHQAATWPSVTYSDGTNQIPIVAVKTKPESSQVNVIDTAIVASREWHWLIDSAEMVAGTTPIVPATPLDHRTGWNDSRRPAAQWQSGRLALVRMVFKTFYASVCRRAMTIPIVDAADAIRSAITASTTRVIERRYAPYDDVAALAMANGAWSSPRRRSTRNAASTC